MTYTIPADKLPELIQAVRDLAAEYPDARYVVSAPVWRCSYNKGEVLNGPGQCGCLIGQAIRRIGLPPVPLVSDKTPVVAFIDGDIDARARREWLQKVQQEQDLQTPWGKAVEVTDETVNLPSTP